MSSPGQRFGKREVGLLIGLGLVVLFILVVSLVPQVRNWINHFFETADEWGVRFGYLGVFVATALANSTIIVPVPYTALLVLLGNIGLNPLLLGLVAGLGAVVGDSTAYFAGRWGRVLLTDKTRQNFDLLKGLVSRHPWRFQLFVFVMGATPIPDDIFLIPLGVMRYPIWRALWPYALGKMILATIFAASGSALGPNLQNLLTGQVGGIWIQALSLLSTVLILYWIARTDWDAFAHRFFKHGLVKGDADDLPQESSDRTVPPGA